jgi:hypothetical protein
MKRVTPMKLASAGVAAVMVALACRTSAPAAPFLPGAMVAISVEAVGVPLAPASPALDRIEEFHYAGGLALSSVQTDRLHGLSDLDVDTSGRFLAVGDEGVLFDGRFTFDAAGRLIGVTDTRLGRLLGEDGAPLPDKSSADAEGLAVFDDGRFLVSFERRNRVWLYQAAGSTPRAAPAPLVSFGGINTGMEALSLLPDTAPDAYTVGAEATGETWTCRLSGSPCVAGPVVDMPPGFALVAMTSLSGGRMAYLLRSFNEEQGNRNILRVVHDGTVLATLSLQRPLSVDNFEGLAAVQGDSGSVRFYLLSDDNGSSTQRTLLLAFDWRQN